MYNVGLELDACDSLTAVFYGSMDSNQGMFITRDGGNNWNPMLIPEGGAIGLSVVNSYSIWYITENNIYRTADGGVSWEKQYSTDQMLIYIKMFDISKGVVISDPDSQTKIPLILRTLNGGHGVLGGGWNNVCSQPIGMAAYKQRVQFIDFLKGYYYSAFKDRKLYKTTDGGISWQVIPFDYYARIVKFYNENIGLVLGSTIPYKLYRTFNGGESWEVINTYFTAYPRDLEFVPGNPNYIWYVDAASLYYSTDTGSTWREYKLTEEDLRGQDLVFVDNNHGWLLCDMGKIFFTNNNGGIITDVYEKENYLIKDDFIILCNYPNPFNAETNIEYIIPKNSFVKLRVFDLLGRRIAELVNEFKEKGNYRIKFDGGSLPSGIYLYTLSSSNNFVAKKMLLIK